MKDHWLTVNDRKSASVLINCDKDAVGVIVIPEGVTLVGDGAFSACSRLSFITVPAGITVGKSAFGNHDPLARTDREDNPKDSDRSGSFFKRIFRRKGKTS